jgi:arylsulfatase A-like enzyme
MVRRSVLLEGTRLLAASVAAIWTLDLLLNLSFLETALRGEPPAARARDFLGLLLAGLWIAISLCAVSWAGGAVVAAITACRDRMKESVLLLSALVSAGTLLIVHGWPFAPAQVWRALPVALSGALLVYGLLRVLSRRRPEGPWLLGEAIPYALFPPILAGFALNAALRWEIRRAVIAAAVILAILVLSWTLRRSLPPWLALILGISPLLGGALLALHLSLAYSSYGAVRESTTTADDDARPSIVLIVLDTLRADHLRRHGYERNTMPALERWAEEALVASRAISPSGWTSPAHASIFTGRTVSEHGVHYATGAKAGGPVIRTHPFPRLPWLTERLSAHGYHCLAVAANSMAVPPEMKELRRLLVPNRDAWVRPGFGLLGDLIFPFSSRISERLRWKTPYADAGSIAEITMRSLPEGDGPFFLFVNFLDPHSPYNPPAATLDLLGVAAERLFDRYQTHRDLTRQWEELPEGTARHVADLYDGELRFMDIHLDRLLRWLDRRLGERAVIIVTSDHGEELGEEGRVGHEYGLSQALIHVPLFARGPGLEAGVIDPVVNLINLYDFILEAASTGRPREETLTDPGRHGAISERYPSGYNRRTLGPEYGRAWVSLIEGGHKGVGPSEEGFHLYDIEARGFTRELPASDAAAGEDLKARIDDYWSRKRDLRDRVDDLETLSEEEIRRLRSLGYVQ